MEKISHILPASRRVTTVDSESSPPVRPGAPAYGRPSEALNVQDRVTLSSLAEERSREPAIYKNPKEGTRARVVDELAERFFNAREMTGSSQPKSAEILERYEDREALAPREQPRAQTPAQAEEGFR